MTKYEYYTPLDVASMLRTESDVALFFEYMIDEVESLMVGKDDDFMPPIVYSTQGRVFNVDYNFMVNCLSKFVGEDRIYGDFVLQENASDEVVRNGLFLVVSILEKYHDVVRANNKRIDLSRYKNKGSIDMSERFYNVLVMQNGENKKRLSAVPFSESNIKKIIHPERFVALENVVKKEKYKQIAFGHHKLKELVIATNILIDFVEF